MAEQATTQSNEARIDKMGTWAAGVREELDDLTAAMIVSTEEHADALSYQLAELLESRKDHKKDYLTALTTKAQLSIPSGLDDEIERIEAQASLDSAGINPKTEKLFTVKQCEARVILALGENEQYKELIAQKRQQKGDLAQARALLETLDREAKEYGRAVDILTSRLDNLTARTGARK